MAKNIRIDGGRLARPTNYAPVADVEDKKSGKADGAGKSRKAGRSIEAEVNSAAGQALAPRAAKIGVDLERPRLEASAEVVGSSIARDVEASLNNRYGAALPGLGTIAVRGMNLLASLASH